MAKIMVWAKTKAWPWIKAHWKLVAGVAGAIVAALFAVKVYGLVRRAVLGTVDLAHASPDFKPLDPTHIAAKDQSGQWVPIELGKDSAGKQITVSDVRAVQLVDQSTAIVEVHNQAIDRRKKL